MTFIVVVCTAMTMFGQSPAFFKPYKATNLRLPAVPLIVNDPYFSLWSHHNQLTDGPVAYWYSGDVEKPIDGMIRVDGTTYRFMGTQAKYVLGAALLPMADQGAWTGKVSYTTQTSSQWTMPTFDDTSWLTQQGAFGSAGEYPHVNTPWTGNNKDIYVRRTMNLTAADLAKDLYIVYSHDDVFDLYINGVKVVQTGLTWLQGETMHIDGTMKQYLKEGTNIISAHCHNTTGGSYVDFGIYENTMKPLPNVLTATQKSCTVMPTSTYYTFSCGPVDLNVVFTAPMLIDDLDLLSTPVNYISYQVTSTDGNQHQVQFYLAASPRIATANTTDAIISTKRFTTDGTPYLKTGTTAQGFHETASTNCIDWGYLYLPGVNGDISLNMLADLEQSFATQGTLPASKLQVQSANLSEYPTLGYLHDFGTITTGSSFAMLAYDEVNDVEFLGQRYKGYWARNGKTIIQAMSEMRDNYMAIMQRCRALDQRIYDDGIKSGNQNYAELLSAAYRQVIAAHKLFQDKDGDLMFFSRENDSGGFINTSDVTYPASPLFLLYNSQLAKATIEGLIKYCETSSWGFPFPAHDIGHYPIANNQHYSITFPDAQGGFQGNMPIEESGNILTIAATVTMMDGNAAFAEKYWNSFKTWADYLVANAQDPANQLCTDDFAGHLAHNANLSIKGILGIAGFALMAKAKGDMATYDTYMNTAKQMAAKWEVDALDADGTHYDLTLDQNGTWSQKYNMVWDKLWGINIFSSQVMQKEFAYYLTKQNTYGIPLDSRETYSKNDWIMWVASMAPDAFTFRTLINPIWKYVNETNSRVPISDWHWTISGDMRGFRARSVIGGYWAKVLMDNFNPLKPTETGIQDVKKNVENNPIEAYYNLSGQRTSGNTKGLNIIHYADGTVKKVMNK